MCFLHFAKEITLDQRHMILPAHISKTHNKRQVKIIAALWGGGGNLEPHIIKMHGVILQYIFTSAKDRFFRPPQPSL